MKQSKHTQSAIAKTLGRNKSSISRELKRCSSDPIGYIPDRANDNSRRLLQKNLSLFHSSSLRDGVINLLKEGWSPEQISGRLKLENGEQQVSHETIYKFIYSEEGQVQKLHQLLPRRKFKRTRWYSRKPKKSHNIPDISSINKAKYTNEVIGDIKNTMSRLPKKYCKTITFDRGTEFSTYADLNLTTFFCDPHEPWQKESSKNFNGRLRRYLPEKFDCRNLSQELLDTIEDKMNN